MPTPHASFLAFSHSAFTGSDMVKRAESWFGVEEAEPESLGFLVPFPASSVGESSDSTTCSSQFTGELSSHPDSSGFSEQSPNQVGQISFLGIFFFFLTLFQTSL